MLPTEKSVSGVTGACGDRTAEPDCPAQSEPSGKTTAAETPGQPPVARMPPRAFCRAAAVASSRWARGETGATSCDVGTGTMLARDPAGLGETVAGAMGEVPDVAASDPLGDTVGAVVPHATTIAARSRPAAALAGARVLVRSTRMRVTRSMVSEKVAAPALSRRGRLPVWFRPGRSDPGRPRDAPSGVRRRRRCEAASGRC